MRGCFAVRMQGSIFRHKALAARQQQWFAPVSVVTPVSAVALLSTAVLVIALLSFAVSRIEVPDKVRVSGVLLPQRSFVEIRASRPGRVRRLGVENGSVVAEGQALLVIDNTTNAPGRDATATEQIDSLVRELGLLDASLLQELSAIERRVDAGRKRRSLLLSRLRLASQEREMQERIARIQNDTSRRVAKLASSSAVSRQQADDYRVAAIWARVAAQGLDREILELQADIESLGRQLLDDQAAAQQLRTRTAMRREALEREISGHRAGAAIEIAATVPGQVTGLAVRDGGFVEAGEVLLTLHEPSSPVGVRLYVPASQAGRVRPGQEVRLKLAAFPEQLYGVQTATVTAISPVALPAEDLGIPLSLRGLVFEARAETLDTGSLAGRLPPGTVVHADIVRYRWSLLQWLLSFRRGIAA